MSQEEEEKGGGQNPGVFRQFYLKLINTYSHSL